MGPHRSLGAARALFALALASIVAFGSVSPASASPACDRVDLPGGQFGLVINMGALPGAGQAKADIQEWNGNIWLYDAQGTSHDCEGSTVDNTQYMWVEGTDGPNALIFRPATKFSPIFIEVQLGGAYDFVCLMGDDGNNQFVGSHYQNGVDGHIFDMGMGVNMFVEGMEMGHFVGNGGKDRLLSMQGLLVERAAPGSPSRLAAGGTSSHVNVPFTMEGGKGNDKMVGGTANDVLLGAAGNDTAKGGAGKDLMKGGAGEDRLNGGPGKDDLKGGGADDRCKGGPGKDKERGC